jgi:hypothetical protein
MKEEPMSRWQVDDHLDVELEDVLEVTVHIVAGDLAVTTAPGPARIEVRRESGPEVDVRFDEGRLHVEQRGEGGLGWLFGSVHRKVAVTLSVPPEVRADLVTVSAPVLASGIRGRVKVKTVSGDVTLADLHDVVDVKTVSGDVDARGITADLKAKTVSGDLTVVDGTCRWVDANSVSGDVLLDLDPDPAGVYTFKTVSGDVALQTRGEPNLLVEASSVSGRLVSDLGIAWEDDRPGRRRVRERIGEGGARLVVTTVSGELRILRKREAA